MEPLPSARSLTRMPTPIPRELSRTQTLSERFSEAHEALRVKMEPLVEGAETFMGVRGGGTRWFLHVPVGGDEPLALLPKGARWALLPLLAPLSIDV